MSAPNLAGATPSVLGQTDPFIVTGSLASMLRAVPATGHCYRLEAVYASNIGAGVPWVTLVITRSGTNYRIVYELEIPAGGSFNLLGGRILYLEEADDLKIQASASSSVEAEAVYEDCS